MLSKTGGEVACIDRLQFCGGSRLHHLHCHAQLSFMKIQHGILSKTGGAVAWINVLQCRGPIALSDPDRAPIVPPGPDQGAIALSRLALLYKCGVQSKARWLGFAGRQFAGCPACTIGRPIASACSWGATCTIGPRWSGLGSARVLLGGGPGWP